jgi:hypothetical protein
MILRLRRAKGVEQGYRYTGPSFASSVSELGLAFEGTRDHASPSL